MLDITELQTRFATLIESRSNFRSVYHDIGILQNSPLRMIGESLLNKFSDQLVKQAILAEQRETIADEIIENIVSSLVLAEMIGVDLQNELTNLISLLESVSSEAS